MKVTKFMSPLLVLLMVLGLSACGNNNDTDVDTTDNNGEVTIEKDSDPVVDEDTTTVDETDVDETNVDEDTTTDDSAVTEELATIYFIDPDSPMKEQIMADENVNAIFVDEGNDIYDNIVGQMREAVANNEKVVIEATEEGKAQGVEDLELKITEHYPLMVFRDIDKDINQIDLDQILETQADAVYVYENDGVRYFAFKDSLFISAIKRVQILDSDMVDTINTKSISLTGETDEDKETLVFVEDPLCPACSQHFLSAKNKEVLESGKYNIKLIPLALEIHPNADELSSMWLANKDREDIVDIVTTTFEKQNDLSGLDFENTDAITDVFNMDIDYNTGIYDAELYNDISTTLGVQGTPTFFKLQGNKLTILGQDQFEAL